MKVAVYGRNIDSSIENYCFILRKLKARAYELCLQIDFARFLAKETKEFDSCETFLSDENLLDRVDFFISLGGDGTFLESTKFVRENNIPIIGINTGSLGFLSNTSIEETDLVLEELKQNKYTLEQRALIEITSTNANGIDAHALNEVSLQRTQTSLISISVNINGEQISNYWSDGLIFATPTGSTAYSMSVGGPIVTPTAAVFIVSPIAPHNLAIRPVVVSSDVEIKIKLQTRGEKAILTADNQMISVESGMEFTVKKSPFVVRIIKPDSVNFYKTLKNKLMWGYDIRDGFNVSQHS